MLFVKVQLGICIYDSITDVSMSNYGELKCNHSNHWIVFFLLQDVFAACLVYFQNFDRLVILVAYYIDRYNVINKSYN